MVTSLAKLILGREAAQLVLGREVAQLVLGREVTVAQALGGVSGNRERITTGYK